MSRKAITLTLSCILLAGVAQAQKKRVAVMNFDYATVQNYVAQIFGSNQDVGKGISDLLVDKLVADGLGKAIRQLVARGGVGERRDGDGVHGLGHQVGLAGDAIAAGRREGAQHRGADSEPGLLKTT